VGRGVRAFVAVFLTTFLVCGVLQVEAWPLSGWKLFSHLRTDEIRGWTATGAEAGGVERPIPFHSFGPGFQGALHVLKGFEGLGGRQRRDVCEAWADELARTGTEILEIRIYATTRSSRHPDVVRTELRYLCPLPS
jgi:hypothetical protein